MPTAALNVYSIFILLAALTLNHLTPTCQNVARNTSNSFPIFTPQLGKIFPITEMHKWPQSALRLSTGLAIPALAAKPATVTHAIPAILAPASPNTHHSRWTRK
jgi:hypothetical protein